MIANHDHDNERRETDAEQRVHDATAHSQTTVGVFASGAGVEQALTALADAGYTKDQIILVGRGSDAADEIPNQAVSDKATEVAVGGALIGGVSGAALALLAGGAALAIPGIGPALVAVGGALIGAAAGGWIGSMALGVPDDIAERYTDLARQGNYILFVRTDSEERDAEVQAILRSAGAAQVDSYPYGVEAEETGQFPGARPEVRDEG